MQAPILTVATFNSSSLWPRVFKNKTMGIIGQMGSNLLCSLKIKFYNAINISFFKNDS